MSVQKHKSQRTHIDLLLVINQDSERNLIIQYLNDERNANVILLSTHYVFSLEREQIVKDLTNQVSIEFLCFADVLKESQLEAADDYAVGHLDSLKDKRFATLYMKWHMLNDKNRRVYKELQNQYAIDKVVSLVSSFFGYSLGVSARFWSTVGNNGQAFNMKDKIKELSSSILVSGLFHSQELLKKRVGLLFKDFDLSYIREDESVFVFHSLKRLNIKNDVKITSIRVRMNFLNSLKFLIAPWKLLLFPKIMALANELSVDEEYLYWCSPVHEYQSPLEFVVARSAKDKLLIFQDAFRPSNYPAYYVHSLWYGKLVPRDMFDAMLFKKFGRQLFLRPKFLCSDKMHFSSIDQNTVKTKTIVLSLNYAGDWTALINRSDTDLLIQVFSDLAPRYPSHDFVIRLHPKMHLVVNAEGKNSRLRVESFVEALALSNLELSQETLETDWERGDVFISEYSLSVIDAIKQGKIGFFVNPTSRLSFMQDYVDLGFVEVKLDRMESMLNEVIKNPNRFYKAQINAMQAYNDAYEAFHLGSG